MNQAPSASIIIPTWNGIAYIEDCLDSLLAQDYPEFEVIIVDNASSDGTPEWVAEHFPMVTLICNKRNLGFAGGVNAGLRAARGEVLMLFNQDAVAEPGWLWALVLGLLAAPDIGIAGCKILGIDGQIIQHAGGYLAMPQALPGHRGLGQLDAGQYDQSMDVEYVSGAAVAVRRDVLETIGYLDENFFFYFEDVDYCYRARAAGFRVIYVPTAKVRHYGKTSLGEGTVAYHARYHISRLQFVIKHWGISYFVSDLQPAECAWVKSITGPEWAGLRRAYQRILEGAGRMVSDLPVDNDTQVELLNALQELRQQVYAAYSANALRLSGQSSGEQAPEAEHWWEVQERPFVSSVPFVGPLIAGIRTLWNSISTKWFVRGILQQQNQVNHILAKRSEMQSQIWSELDRDQTRLTTQLAEIIFRLEKIEARLAALEERR